MFDKLAWQRRKRRADPPGCVARDKAYRLRRRTQVFSKLGGKCSNPACQWLNADGSRGCRDERCLQIDHVFDDGYKDRKGLAREGLARKGLSRTTFYNRVLADTEGRYQLLCANCNWIKKWVHDHDNKKQDD